MAPRVFFCFDYEHDFHRAVQMREVLCGAEEHVGGFFNQGEARDIEQRGDAALKVILRDHLRHTDVTVVLVGLHTAKLRWVKHAIERSIKRGNAFVGLFIHPIPDADGNTCDPGRKPPVPWGTEFPAYTWDGDADRLRKVVDAAGRRAELSRGQRKKRSKR